MSDPAPDDPTPIAKVSAIDRFKTPEHKAAAAKGRRDAAAKRQAVKASAEDQLDRIKGIAAAWNGRDIDKLTAGDLAEAIRIKLMVAVLADLIEVSTPTQANQLIATMDNLYRLERGLATSNTGSPAGRDQIMAQIQDLAERIEKKGNQPPAPK